MSDNTMKKQALPEQSKDAIIQKLEIGEIVVDIVPEPVEQKNIVYKQIQLPPLPEAYIKTLSEIKGLQTAFGQLLSPTHESLRQANFVVELAQSQFNEWLERKEQLWESLEKNFREKLEKRIYDNPNCTEQSVGDLLPDKMTNQQYFNFIEQFQCGKKCAQARLELTRVLKEQQEKWDNALARLKLQLEENEKRLEEIKSEFLDTVLIVILSTCPEYNKLNADFPEDSVLAPFLKLDKYELGWSAVVMFSRARELWGKKRPCVIEEQKRKDAEDAEKIKNGPDDNKAGTRFVKIVNNVEFAFRWCPAGTFMMGSPAGFLFWGGEAGRCWDETRHAVTLTKGFWIQETQVTQKQWKAVMGTNPSKSKGENLPVETISWNDCQEFCKKCMNLGLPLSLPTEAQWEYACRAGTTGPYAGNLDEMAWYKKNCDGQTHPVGTKKANAWGLYDMHGNVWELCADWDDWYENSPNGSLADPIGPSDGTHRVCRGGCCYNEAHFCRSATRNGNTQEDSASGLGVRGVLNGQ